MVSSIILGAALLVLGSWGGAMATDQKAQQQADVPKVVAKVNGKPISGEQYRRLLKQMEATRGQERPGQAQADSKPIKDQVLERLITVEVLAQKADQMKMQVPKEELEEKMKEITDSLGGEEAMGEALKAHGITLEELRADVQRSLNIQRLLDREVFEKVTVNQDEVKEFYDSNPQVFRVPEQVRARHIVVRVREGATDSEKKQAREAIEKAEKRIKKGEAFEDVAKEVSQDATAPRGGDLGYFGRGQMVPEFENVAFSLEKGKVSHIVETKFGYHLIKVEDRREPRTLELQEVEARIAEFLRQRRGEEQLRNYVEGLKAQAKIERVSF